MSATQQRDETQEQLPTGNRKQIIEDKVLIKDSTVDGEQAQGKKMRKIKAKDGRTMRQTWDVTININTGTIQEQTNYKQVSPRGWAGSHPPENERTDRVNVDDGTVVNQTSAERQNIAAIMPSSQGPTTVTINMASKIGQDVIDDSLADETTRDYYPEGYTLGDFRDGFDEPNSAVTYDTI